jgi:hypothetical protein
MGIWIVIAIALALLGVEVIYDGWSTHFCMSRGAVENNPLARWLVSRGVVGIAAACVLGWLAAAIPAVLLVHFGHGSIGYNTVGALIAVGSVIGEGINCLSQHSLVKQYEKTATSPKK